MVARTDKTMLKSCEMTRWSSVILFGAGAVAYLAAMMTGPMFSAWGVVFAVTLFCLRQIRQGRISFGTRSVAGANGTRGACWPIADA
jgi:hypothetical protein